MLCVVLHSLCERAGVRPSPHTGTSVGRAWVRGEGREKGAGGEGERDRREGREKEKEGRGGRKREKGGEGEKGGDYRQTDSTDGRTNPISLCRSECGKGH